MALATIFADISSLLNKGKSAASKFTNSAETKIGELALSTSLKEEIKYSNTSTDHNVSRGASVSDHILHNQTKFRITGNVNDSVADFFSAGRNLGASFAQGNLLQSVTQSFQAGLQGKSQKLLVALDMLENMAKSEQLVTLVMYWKVYENVLIEDITIIRDPSHGRFLYFEASLKQLTFADVKTVNIANNPKNVVDAVSPRVQRGFVQTQEATDAQKEAVKEKISAFKRGKDGGINLFKTAVQRLGF